MRCTKQIGLFAFFLLPIIQPFTIQATANKQASRLQQTDEKRTGERLLSGNVTDKGNEPLIGVTVQINGMKRNAITNAEGRYRLYIPQGTCKVTFSYVGMKSQTISFNGGSESLQQNIVMHEDKQLDEVVVTGFYTRSSTALMLYQVTSVYAPACDAGIRWDTAGIPWDVEHPILSERDQSFPALADFVSPFA